jgi:hypothetical protein
MLEMAEWIIPDETKKTLTPGDWVFITLSIYLHDIGLLISRKEFDSRDTNSEYKRYLSDSKQSPNHNDYMAKLNQLDTNEKERVLYQEFVRATHGTRVKAWIEGTPLDDADASLEIRDTLQRLLANLDSVVKKDLALVCESHTKDDIADISKYKVSQPYGESQQETVNLQYTAVILRTVDLLQITRSRAPSILFRIINPTDPTSQVEWQKQGAVRSVRKALGKDRDGQPSPSATPDTIQVHALFKKSDGFFGLTSYLAYAKEQLSVCHEAIRKSEPLLETPPKYPWKYIDDSTVEAEGFLTKAYGFELDQQKILDLLTGHTLYNDTNVVLRELTQNSLDAVRLQASILGEKPEQNGRIDIRWDSTAKTLEISDNGTGMSQSVVENHLLKVGSSRYQDPKFIEQYPGFTSISRFGIGVLSAFMVADSVEITTCSIEEEKARQISLRSVHGKYLIKLLDKVSDREKIGVYPNGSVVRLTLRSTAEIGDILEIARTWLLFPRCTVYVTIDTDEPVRIGFDSPKEAVEYYINNSRLYSGKSNTSIQAREFTEAGVTLAYAVKRDELFNDWSLVQVEDRKNIVPEDDNLPLVATCIEGVGVEFTTPGFAHRTILAIANVSGPGAPKTNVARTALEDTAEYRNMLEKIYRHYARHITNEVKRLAQSPDYSLSRAVEQAPYIAAPLTMHRHFVSRPNLLDDELSKVPLILLEQNGERKNLSLHELRAKHEFWTVDSPLTSSVEFFVREAPGDISASIILERLKDKSSTLPGDVTLCNLNASPYVEGAILKYFEPCMIEADERARRISIKWAKTAERPRWISSADIYKQFAGSDRRMNTAIAQVRNEYRHRESRIILLPLGEIETSGLENARAFIANKRLYLNPADSIAVFLRDQCDLENAIQSRKLCIYLLLLDQLGDYKNLYKSLSLDLLDRVLSRSSLQLLKEEVDIQAFVEAARESKTGVFNPFAWQKRSTEED